MTREELLSLIEKESGGNLDIVRAFGNVDRKMFVPEKMKHYAYENVALPIGSGQTISQPTLVSHMTNLLGLGKDSEVLEVGTGSGYQTAILCELSRQVYSIERVPELAKSAEEMLLKLGYKNFQIEVGDGTVYFEEKKKFDSIIVTACATQRPDRLLSMLSSHGRAVIPIKVSENEQRLFVYERYGERYVESEDVAVKFVPLIQGKYESN